MPERPPSLLDWFFMFLLALVWGASFIFIKKSVQIFSPLQMAVWRMSLATIAYLPIAVIFWHKIDWKRWRPLIVVALFGSAIPNFFFAVAQQHVNSSLAGILNSLTPLFTLITGTLFFRKQFSRNNLIGVVLGLSGASLLILYNAQTAVSGNAFYAALCVLATVCYAINANSMSRYLHDMHPAAIASAAFMIAGLPFLLGLPATGALEAAGTHPEGWVGVGYIAYLAVLGTVGGSILYFRLIQRTSTIFATSVTYLLPITSIVIGMFDGEKLLPTDLLGVGIILTGLYLARK